MFSIGKIQKLTIKKIVDFGAYLVSKDNDDEEILLPKKQVPKGAKVSDEVKVFIYRDSKDRLIATTNTPYITLGHMKKLMVVQVSSLGAFLDFGLERDLFLPYKEQTVHVNRGDSYLVRLYVDKSDRLCASMKLYHHLYTDHNYQKGDEVIGTIYDKSDEYGYFVAVDDMYSALIPKREAFGNLYIGKEVKARIIDVKEDGKIDLAVRDVIKNQIGQDANQILTMIHNNNGHLGFTEKESPEVIKQKTGLSKAAFKRAIGHLLKNKQIEMTIDDVLLVEMQ